MKNLGYNSNPAGNKYKNKKMQKLEKYKN